MVTFTTDAYAELARRVAASEEPDPFVSVCWLTRGLDLVRSPQGDAVWKEVYPATWAVAVQGLPEEYETEKDKHLLEQHRRWIEEHIVWVDGLRVHFWPEGSRATDVTVDFRDGQFRVQHDAV